MDGYFNFKLIDLSARHDCITNHFCRHALLFEDIGGEYNIGLATNANTVREFDDALTRGMRPFCSLAFLEAI